MKKAALLLFLLPAISLAQQIGAGTDPAGTVPTSVTFPTERLQTPTAADLYCAGFVSKKLESRSSKYVAGGWDSPFTTHYANGESIFLHGSNYEAGQEYTVVREVVDPNRYELFKGQWSALKAAGQPYEELARVKIVDTRHKMAIAEIEYSCDTVLPGDYLIPFVDKQRTEFHPPIRFDRYAPPSSQVSGRIILAKDFDSELGTGGKVYLNIGANQGLKIGDFLKAERSYEQVVKDPVDSASFYATAVEPTQAHQVNVQGGDKAMPSFMNGTSGPIIHPANMPHKVVGEIVIIGTTPSTATGMIVFALEPVYVGDRVEIDQQ